jgi:hypothetical protein
MMSRLVSLVADIDCYRRWRLWAVTVTDWRCVWLMSDVVAGAGCHVIDTRYWISWVLAIGTAADVGYDIDWLYCH